MENAISQVELLRKHQSILRTKPSDYLSPEKQLMAILENRHRAAHDWETLINEESKIECGKVIEWCNAQLKLMLDIF